jgi:hypothetical protein
MLRYVVKVEPLASAPAAEVAGWVGPTLQRLPVLCRHNRNEQPLRPIPPTKLTLRPRTAGVPRVLFNEPAQNLELAEVRHVRQLHHSLVAMLLELTELIQHERHPATHARGEVAPVAGTTTVPPVMCAAVIADAFHTAIAPLLPARPARPQLRRSSFARRRAVEHIVADKNI